MNQPGFSLLEVTIVLALITFIFSLNIAFSWKIFDTALVRLELDNLYMLFASLQQQALIDHKEHVLQFDPEHNCYHWDDHKHQLPSSVCFGIMPKACGPPSNPARPLNKSITFPANQVTFYPEGFIQPGTLYLTNTDKTILYALSCPISDISYIRCYQFDTQWHPLS